ncbi:aspartyl/asparaginyl beta-hydroxylase domain-containing protein [Erythrobacter insulae]|uniref:Aspartyl/asparaginyl beta-hydroxylase domain-containing protein n=1 Tax=Erythrobacter insulae TaxID=2584124 RepID=A0A547P6Y6_9SPHN|nr:aspartyl/asparaginyl beta-hydroxylase domain-containing protein [Erythrobacter insulae]TRD09888.1 aspartyl/asparaginyl beta-hydroxylase domain-containing protein [Erythrobacter insulae]
MGLSNTLGLLSNDPGRPLHYRFFKRQRHRVNDQIAKSSLISNEAVFAPETFEWPQKVANHWQAIRDEAQAIYRHRDAIPPLREISPDHRGIVKDNAWRSFFLIGYGHRQEQNIARAPRTAELVSQIPGLNSAFFSILAPGSEITPHRGVTKAFITAHLGLVVPIRREKCWMRVGDHRLNWANGEWTIFDDTYEHEVKNETDETRIILLCQVERPLRAPGSWLAAGLMGYVRRSHFVREAKDNLTDWETAYAKAEREIA